jgi:hypothetical protein
MNESDGASGDADLLEARYRRALRLLPSGYRAQRGEEMVSVLLDGAMAGRRWPSVAELASLVALATRLRVGAPGGTRRAAATGEVLRRTALAGLLAMGSWFGMGGVSTVVLFFSEHYYFARETVDSTWTWPFTLDAVQPLVYFGAFAALLTGARRLGRVLGVAQAIMVAAQIFTAANVVTSDRAAIFTVAAVIALAGGLGFHPGAAPMPTPRRWLAVGAGVAGGLLSVSAAVNVFEFHTPAVPSALTFISRLAVGPLVPAIAVVFGVLRARTSPIWPAALLFLGLPGLLLVPRAVSLYAQGKAGHFFLGDLFPDDAWLGMAVYLAITDTILALALAWALYRRRVRSTAVAA